MLRNFIIDFTLITLALVITVCLRAKTFTFTAEEIQFISIYYISWFISTILSKKIIKFNKLDKYTLNKYFMNSFFFMILLIIIFNQIFNFVKVSRYIIGGSLFLGLLFEFIWIKLTPHLKPNTKQKFSFYTASVYAFILDLFLITWIIYFEIIANIQDFKIYSDINLLLFSIYIVWFISGLSFHSYDLKIDTNYWLFIWKYLRTYIVLLLSVSFLTFFLRIPPILELSVIFSVTIYSLWSFLLFTFYFFVKIPKRTDETRLKFIKATVLSDDLFDERKIIFENQYVLSNYKFPGSSIKLKLKEVYLKQFDYLFERIDKRIDLDTIDVNRSVILRSSDPYNVETLPTNYLDLFFNLHELNDQRRLNAYLIEINKKLRDGGIFIGLFEPIRNRHKRFHQKYPFFIAKLFYAFDFIWKRVTPKIPIIQKIYFAFTRGRDRALSMAEGIGRLYYCGYEIMDVFEIGYEMVFIAVKVKDPSKDMNPSYGPFFKMRRIGKDGKCIFVYKTRTMHPYSEYIQKFIYDLHGTKDGDKIIDDFRITIWGKILRKFWLDELPMIINLIKGELKIVGIRPLSKHKYSLYPENLQKLRILTKPGLIPPYYADLPKTQEDFFLSELKYLEEYFKNPIKTDIKYFFKAFHNIIFKNARSA